MFVNNSQSYIGIFEIHMKGGALQRKIEELIQPIIETMGFVLWGCELHSSGRHTLLRVFIDVPDSNDQRSINIDDCSLVSNQISAVLDVEDIIANSYNLEVSSPGLDRALFKIEHYQKYLGQLVKLSLLQSINGRRHITGTIKTVDGLDVSISVDNEIFKIPFVNITKAHLVPNFRSESV